MIQVGYTREAEFTGSPSSIFSRSAPPTILEPGTGYEQKEKKNQKNFQTVQFSKKMVLITGAPNENIVQNHLNIAILNVF